MRHCSEALLLTVTRGGTWSFTTWHCPKDVYVSHAGYRTTLGSYPNSNGQKECSWLSVQTLRFDCPRCMEQACFSGAERQDNLLSEGTESCAGECPEIGRYLENEKGPKGGLYIAGWTHLDSGGWMSGKKMCISYASKIFRDSIPWKMTEHSMVLKEKIAVITCSYKDCFSFIKLPKSLFHSLLVSLLGEV